MQTTIFFPQFFYTLVSSQNFFKGSLYIGDGFEVLIFFFVPRAKGVDFSPIFFRYSIKKKSKATPGG